MGQLRTASKEVNMLQTLGPTQWTTLFEKTSKLCSVPIRSLKPGSEGSFRGLKQGFYIMVTSTSWSNSLDKGLHWGLDRPSYLFTWLLALCVYSPAFPMSSI